MNILIIDADEVSLDFALRCTAEGHDVRVFMSPPAKGGRALSGDGLIVKVTDWRRNLKWADLIVTTDNTKYLKELDGYRAQGYPIFGATWEVAQWEIDRELGMKVFEQHGIKCLPSVAFKNYKDGMAYVLANPEKRLVCKPIGDVQDKSLSYVSKSSRDMLFMLQKWQREGKRIPYIFQDFTPGIEMAVGAWVGRNGFSQYVLENFEFKKLMNGEVGVNTGEMGCYDAETEVLTSTGWKYWPEVTMADKLASLENGKTVFVSPSEVVSFDFKGEMVTWQNQTLDIKVTPNHNMYVQRQDAARKQLDKYEFIQAENCTQAQYEVMRTADWEGTDYKLHEIPAYTHAKGLGFATLPAFYLDAEAWARLVGLYIAEGSCTHSQVSIAQSHPEKALKVSAMLAATGLDFKANGRGFVLSSVQVAQLFYPLGRSWEKRIPDYIKNSSKRIIRAFLEGYALGDGNTQDAGFRIFYTCNRELAGDVQELLLKIGRVGVLKKRDWRGQCTIAPDGHAIIQRRDAYEVLERVQKLRSWLDKRDKFSEYYEGKVYCATVPSHVLYVRRNGKPLWCGNTVMRYVPASESRLFQLVLAPIEAELIRQGYTGYIDVAVIIDKKGNPWPLEFTSRMGWPLFFIQQVIHKNAAQWMKDSLMGLDTFEPHQEIAVGVLAAMKDFPYSTMSRELMCGFPVWGVDEKNRYFFHPVSLMAGTGPDLEKGKLKEMPLMVSAGNYLLVMSGIGKTVEQAAEHAYENLSTIELANSPLYRTDIGKRLEHQLPELQAMGYATSWEYA